MGKIRGSIFFFILATVTFWCSSAIGGCDSCDEITSDDVAWEHMDEVDNEGQCECRYGQFVRTGTLVHVWEPGAHNRDR